MKGLILGLDTASLTGFCKYDIYKKSIIESGIINLRKVRGESNGVLFLKFSSWLENELTNNNITLVGYEQAHHRGGAPTEIGINLTGRIQELCTIHQVEYTTVRTTTLKKFATDNGRASKEEMIEAANKILITRPVVDDNEADAIHVAMWTAYTVYGIE